MPFLGKAAICQHTDGTGLGNCVSGTFKNFTDGGNITIYTGSGTKYESTDYISYTIDKTKTYELRFEVVNNMGFLRWDASGAVKNSGYKSPATGVYLGNTMTLDATTVNLYIAAALVSGTEMTNRIPTTCSLNQTSGTVYNANISLNCTGSVDLDGNTIYYLWTVNGTVKQNGTSSSYTTSFVNEGNYLINVTTNDANNTGNSSITAVYTLDVTKPIITIDSPLNGTIYTSGLLNIDTTCSDNGNVFTHNWNLTNSSGGLAYSSTNFNISPTTSNHITNNSINWNTLISGNYTFNVYCADTHTGESLLDIYTSNIDLTAEKVTVQSKDTIIITSQNAPSKVVDIETQALKDRISYIYDYSDSIDQIEYKYEFVVDSDKPIYYLPNSHYRAHFVTGEHWVDFELTNDPKAKYDIIQIKENQYKVIIHTNQKILVFSSIGELNIQTKMVRIYYSESAPSLTNSQYAFNSTRNQYNITAYDENLLKNISFFEYNYTTDQFLEIYQANFTGKTQTYIANTSNYPDSWTNVKWKWVVYDIFNQSTTQLYEVNKETDQLYTYIINFVDSQGNPKSTSGTIIAYNKSIPITKHFSASSLSLTNNDFEDNKKVTIGFNGATIANLSQHYEYINDEQSFTVNLLVLDNPSLLQYFEIKDSNEFLQEGAIVLTYQSNSTNASGMQLIDKTITESNGLATIILDEDYSTLLEVSATGYNSMYLQILTSQLISGEKTKITLSTSVTQPRELIYINVLPTYKNTTQTIIGYIKGNSSQTYTINTDYRIALSQEVRSLNHTLSGERFTLYKGIDYAGNGSDIIIYIYHQGSSTWSAWANITYANYSTNDVIAQTGLNKGLKNFLIGIILILVASVLGAVLKTLPDASMHIFFTGGIVAALLSESYYYFVFVSTMFYLGRWVNKMIKNE